jgi:transposase-like protein
MTFRNAKSIVNEGQCSGRRPATDAVSRMRGGPTRYTAELAERILHELSGGRSLRDICRDHGLPDSSTVWHWVTRDREGFAARYHRAREAGHAMICYATLYTAEVAERILQELSDGRSLRDICRDRGMPSPSAVQDWVSSDREGFAARYNRAREVGHTVTGRPTPYTAELAERILHELSGGRSLSDVCRDHGMPNIGTVRFWVIRDRDGFAARYHRAREVGHAPTGRPTLYTAETSERILHALWDGRTLSDVCHDHGMPAPSTVRKWEIEDREGFAARYSEARELGYHIMSGEILDIADNARGDREDIRRARLRVKARCWLLSKALPKIYGDRRAVKPKTRCRR